VKDDDVDLTVCPECGSQAEVRWRAVLESTDGPIEHAKVLCRLRHWFLLPVSDLAARRSSPKYAATVRDAKHHTSTGVSKEARYLAPISDRVRARTHGPGSL
jgi:hypothetical protein